MFHLHHSQVDVTPAVDAYAPIHFEVYEPVKLMSDHRVFEEIQWAGPCQAKLVCGRNPQCHGFIHNVRDGRADLFQWKEPDINKAHVVIEEAMADGGAGITRTFIKVSSDRNNGREVVEESELDFTPYSFITGDKTNMVEDTSPPSSNTKTTPGVVVSLTTIPSRIDSIQGTLLSLIAQTLPPDKILLSIPETSSRENGQHYTIPPWLKEMDDKVTIVMSKVDYGPSTKLIPTVKVRQ